MTKTYGVPAISVIIPTFNRKPLLSRSLACLRGQTLAPEQVEVIVIDDGSSDGTPAAVTSEFLFNATYHRQDHQGATEARNVGASLALGELLVFLDDDICVVPDFLRIMGEAHQRFDRAIIIGQLVCRSLYSDSVYGRIVGSPTETTESVNCLYEVPFTDCLSGCFSVKKAHFLELGAMEGLQNVWPNWDDTCFGYRAHVSGFTVLKACAATGYHYDHALESVEAASERWYRACRSAPLLFTKYPSLQANLPMFSDKTPICWGRDNVGLIAHKIARQLTSTFLILELMRNTARLLERWYPHPGLLRPLYRWITGGHMFRGYRQGLKDYAPR